MEVKDVSLIPGNRYLLFHCPECEEKYEVPVECMVKVGVYSWQKWKRATDFQETHEKCVKVHPLTQKLFDAVEEKKKDESLLGQAIEMFEPVKVQEFPEMEEILI